LLDKRISELPNWYKCIDNKVLIGSSASTDMLSTYNFDLEHFECSCGLGLVPVKTMVTL